MAKIEKTTIHEFQNGEVVTAEKVNPINEIFRVAINDNDDKATRATDDLQLHKTSADHDIRYYTKQEIDSKVRGGNTTIKTEVFVVTSANNGDGTFTYTDEFSNEHTGTLTPEGYQTFELTKGEYPRNQNMIEAIINDTLIRTASSGGLVETSETSVTLTTPVGDGTKVMFKYYERIGMMGEHAITHEYGGTDPIKGLVYYGVAAPANPYTGMVWVDPTGTPGGGGGGGGGDNEPALEPATIIVAAPDSSESSKNVAHIKVPEGSVAAQIYIQEAIDALPPVGGKVLLMEGTYIISGRIRLRDNVALEGMGRSTIIRVVDDLDTNIQYIISHSDWAEGNAGMSVRNLVLDGNIDNNTKNYAGVYFSMARDVVVDGIKIINMTGIGVQFVVASWNVVVNNCYIESRVGVYFNNTYSSIVEGNYIKARSDGITILGGEGITIANNFVDESGHVGMDIFNAVGTIVKGNKIHNASSMGISMGSKEAIISDNIITSSGTGASLWGSEDVTVTGNRFTNGSEVNIEVGGDSEKIVITGNCCIGGSTLGSITILQSESTLVSNNFVTGSFGDGIFVNTSAVNACVVGNVVRECIGEGIYTRSNNSIISNNVVTENSGNGVRVSSDSSNSWVTNNYLLGNASAGLSDQGTNTNTTAGNRV